MDKWLKKITQKNNTNTTTKEPSQVKLNPIPPNDNDDDPSQLAQLVSSCSKATTSIPNSNLGNPYGIVPVILNKYPSTEGRSFRSNWFDLYPWLVYIVEKDAAVCHVCRVYGVRETKENIFIEKGYRNWKHALSKGRGFQQHQESRAHIINHSKWAEERLRVAHHAEISTLVNDSVLEKNRYYVSSIFDIIRFIAEHEIAFRGSYDVKSHRESGIFVDLFEYTLRKDSKLAEAARAIPQNATYLSGEIQNEIIGIMASAVKKKLCERVSKADVRFFTLLADGTREKNNNEAISICLRYVVCAIPTESLLSIKDADYLDADTTTNLILDTLRENDIDCTYLLSQCYDGASVMSGKDGGVQAIIKQKLGRSNIPYVHCYNHKFHLIIKFVMSEVTEIRLFYNYCAVIHKVFRRFNFKEFYDGTNTARLMEQRWSGHLRTAEAVYKNYDKMISALTEYLSQAPENLDGEEMIECQGLLNVMKAPTFAFTLCAVLKVLRIIEPADRILQSKESGLASALPVIKTVYGCMKDCRSDVVYEEVLSDSDKLGKLLPSCTTEIEINADDPPVQPKRKIKPNNSLNSYVLTESSGIYSSYTSKTDNFKRFYFEMFDLVISEFERRFFNDKNDELMNVIDNSIKLDPKELECLKKFNIVVPSSEELMCVRRFFEQNNVKKEDYLIALYKLKPAFITTYNMLAALATFGCSSARCESSFSVLTRILTPYRRSMTFKREANLALLAFEKKLLDEISNEELLHRFNSSRSRKLQLY